MVSGPLIHSPAKPHHPALAPAWPLWILLLRYVQWATALRHGLPGGGGSGRSSADQRQCSIHGLFRRRYAADAAADRLCGRPHRWRNKDLYEKSHPLYGGADGYPADTAWS